MECFVVSDDLGYLKSCVGRMRSEHLRVSLWQDLKGDQNPICDKMKHIGASPAHNGLMEVETFHLNLSCYGKFICSL